MVNNKEGLEILAKLRVPFEKEDIGKLPKPSKKQTDEVKANFKIGVRCGICGGWHHPDVIHLDYVGHAALTKRLLDVDPEWSWEPMGTDEKGLPAFFSDGLWIKLTISGITRIGFGDAGGKTGGNGIKEAIGDALRNAGMRFGMALELWHKGDFHQDDDEPKEPQPKKTINDVPDEIHLMAKDADMSEGDLLKGCENYKWDFKVIKVELQKLIDIKAGKK